MYAAPPQAAFGKTASPFSAASCCVPLKCEMETIPLTDFLPYYDMCSRRWSNMWGGVEAARLVFTRMTNKKNIISARSMFEVCENIWKMCFRPLLCHMRVLWLDEGITNTSSCQDAYFFCPFISFVPPYFQVAMLLSHKKAKIIKLIKV